VARSADEDRQAAEKTACALSASVRQRGAIGLRRRAALKPRWPWDRGDAFAPPGERNRATSISCC